MPIDIIDLTSEEYSNLNAVQLAMVRAAQAKKDKLTGEADAERQNIYFQLLANNTARGSLYNAECARINAKLEADVEVVRADLMYQLAYEGLQSEGNASGPYRYPENPNYNLTPSQRFLAVRTYYMAVEDPDARLQAYAMDTLAREYLGEFYQTLYELLASYC